MAEIVKKGLIFNIFPSIYHLAMNSRKFAGIFAAIFVLGAFPLVVVQSSGIASVGLSSGFVAPLNNIYHLAVMIGFGLLGTMMGGAAALMLPTAFILMMTIGAMIDPVLLLYPPMRYFLLGAILLFAVAVSLAGTRMFLLAVAVSSSVAFQLGGFYIAQVPEIATPLYYLLGVMMCVILLLATGVSLGYSISSELRLVMSKLKNIPPVAALMSFFL